MTTAFIAQLIQAATFFALGFLVESWTEADIHNTGANVRFNASYTFLRILFDAATGGVLAFVLTRFIAMFHLRPVIMISGNHAALIAFAFSLVALCVRDFFYYWFHRLQHSSSLLWAEHELHHSDEHMNVTTALRHHWLETPIETALVVIPAALIFQQVHVTLWVYLFSAGAGYFIHMNSTINLGSVFGSPAVHRVHHSKLPEHLDKNFAAFFPVWDVLFGTYITPPKDPPPTGLTTGQTVYSLPLAMIMPFLSWWKMATKSNRKQPIHNPQTSPPSLE